MPNISQRDLSVFISLLSSKIAEMKRDLRDLAGVADEDLNDAQLDNQYQLQETIEVYDTILGGVREEYEAGHLDGINLPSYEELTRPADS